MKKDTTIKIGGIEVGQLDNYHLKKLKAILYVSISKLYDSDHKLAYDMNLLYNVHSDSKNTLSYILESQKIIDQ